MKRFIAFLLVLVLAVSSPAYAAFTPSDADRATSSDATCFLINDLQVYSLDDGIMLLDLDEPTLQGSTADIEGCFVEFSYNSTNGSSRTRSVHPDSDGNFKIVKPSDYASLRSINLIIPSTSYPPAGTYTLDIQLITYDQESEFICSKVLFQGKREINNAKDDWTTSSEIGVYGANYFYTASVISLDLSSYLSKMYFRHYYSGDLVFNSDNLLKGVAQVRFLTYSGDADYSMFPSEYDNMMIDNTYQITQNTASISDTLKELIKHISDQLAALWDQMYNYMHLPHLANDDKNTQLIIDKLSEDLNVEITNQDGNTKDIVDTLDKNTQDTLYGYDNTDMENTTDTLSDTLTEYESLESAVSDSVNDLSALADQNVGFTSFEDAISGTGLLEHLSLVSLLLEKIYMNMGHFSLAIDLSLIFVFASMILGYFRFSKR